MLTKPNVFTRNDSVARRDPQPVVGNVGKPVVPGNTLVSDTHAAASKSPVAANSAISSKTENGLEANGEPGEARMIVGPNVKLKGAEILDCDTLVVEGRIEATMDSRVIRIAEKGYFSGKVSIDIAEIHGTFEGDLTARSQLIIHSTGRVSGTIRFGKLVVDEGGQVCGDVNIMSEKSPSLNNTSVAVDVPVRANTAVA